MYLGWFAVLHTVMFTNLDCNLVYCTATQLVFRPVSSALNTSAFIFEFNFEFSKAINLFLDRIAVLYILVFAHLIVILYLAMQSSLYLGRFSVLYTLEFTNIIVTL